MPARPASVSCNTPAVLAIKRNRSTFVRFHSDTALQVARTLARGLARRVFGAWRRLLEERWWKTQLGAREREMAALEAKIRGYEKRPVTVRCARRASAEGAGFVARCLWERVRMRFGRVLSFKLSCCQLATRLRVRALIR